jgi:hypothetical protein
MGKVFDKHTINIEELATGGAMCSKSSIVWDDPKCAGIICEKNNGKTIKVSIPDDCDERCFWVTYTCLDKCKDCDNEPIRMKVCPCEGPEDCENGCDDCIDGVCVSKCNDNEFCNDADTCVECDPDNPCPNGKQCVGGKCQCPPSKPYTNKDGDCVPCLDGTCPPGWLCTPDGCEPPNCDEGVWSDSKQKCVTCLNSGDCGPNECCNSDNECDCCPNFERDPVTKLCVPKKCVEDDDCKVCEYCKTGEGCLPKDCGDGFVCIPEEDGCVEECNCNNPDCSEGAACVTYSSTTCYCKKCEGSCANGVPCGDGCYCDENFECQPNPCANVTCTTGSECGDGCGCNEETHMCEPCSSAECGDECDNLLGCECVNGATCSDVKGCDGPCDGFGDCPPGCTCDGGWCRPCSDFSCETDDCSDHPECKCTGSGCEGDADFCQDTFIDSEFDCGVKAQLKLVDGCMCSPITAYITPYAVIKDVPFFNSKPAKHLVSLSLRLAKGAADTWGAITQLHLLDETQYENIADNDTPISGSIEVTVRQFYQPQVWSNSGGWVNQGPVVSEVLPVGGSISFANIARKENIQFTAHKIGIGIDVVDDVSQKKIVRYEISTKVNQLSFVNNCVYQATELDTIVLDAGTYKSVTDSLDSTQLIAYWDTFISPSNGNFDLGGKFVESDVVASKSRRNPLYTWYRSDDNVYSKEDIIRKIYISPDFAGGNIFSDSLFGPATFDLKKQDLVSPEGRVFGDMFYQVTNDCACNNRTLDFGKMQWCSPDSLALGNIVFTQCNKKIEIKSDIPIPCPTNWDLNSFNLHPSDNTTAFKAKHQAKYHLMIVLENGTSYDLPYIYKEVGGVKGLYSEKNNTPIRTYTQTFESPVASLKLELRYGTSTEVVCNWEKAVPAPTSNTPLYTKICEPGSTNIKYRFQLAPNHITSITATGGSIINGGSYKDIVAVQGQTVTAYFEFSDYCPLTMELNEFCCDTLTIDMTVNQIPGPALDVITELTSVITGGTLPYSVKYYRQGSNGTPELVGESQNGADSFRVLLSNPTPGLYYGSVSDGSGNCTKNSTIVSIEPRNQNDYNVTITPVMSGCAYTGNVKFTIPSQPDIVNSKIYYKVDSGSDQYFTVTNQMASAGFHLLPATGHTIDLVKIEIPNQSGPATVFTLTGSATVPSNLNSAIPYVNTFTLNGTSPSVNTCSGSDVLIELNGSPNAIVQINGIAPIQLDGAGYGSSVQNPVSTTTYTIVGITSADGGCTGTQGLNISRQASVTPAPEITVVNDVCDGTGTYRTITFSNVTSVTDQSGNPITVSGSSVTVNVTLVRELIVTYSFGVCTATLRYTVNACGAPSITGTVSGPDIICNGETATITVSGVTGGTAPYSYNYYTNADYNETYVLGQTSKVFALAATDTVYVRVQDALGNISAIGSKTVTVANSAEPDIVPIAGQTGVEETSDNVFEIEDNQTAATFKTALNYSTYNWLVTGTYGGTTSGSGNTFEIDVTQITGTIQLQVTVTTENGCVGTETISMSVIAAPVLLAADEILFSTASYKLFKVQVSTSSIGIPTQLCGSSNPAYGLALRSNGDLIGLMGITLYKLYPLSGCSNVVIGTPSWVVGQGIGMLTADKVVGQIQNKLQTYDLSNNTTNTNHYTISDGSNIYSNAPDLVKIGTYLYTVCARAVGGIHQDHRLLRFTLDGSGAVTAFANIGILPNPSASPVGIAYDGTDAYLIFGDGKVYNLNLTTPASSTLIGTIIVPLGEGIADVTNN